MNTRNEKYWLKANAISGSSWSEVSKEDWIKAERAAGFRPNNYMKVCATGGFSNSAGISGSITYDGNPPRH